MQHFLLIIATSLPYIIHTTHERTKNSFTYESNDTYWRSLTPFTPINNASYGTIKLGRVVHMEFSFIYHSRNPLSQNSSTLYENAFRIGYGHETNTGLGAGSRYPSMWIYYKSNKYPHIEFSISDSKSNWHNYPPRKQNDLSINKEQLYKCIIDFNQTYVSINLSSHPSYQSPRQAGTASNILDSFMYVWIAQFGHDDKAQPVTNITMFDIIIDTSNPPTQSPTKNPTLSPIESIVSDRPIELYEFYNEPLEEYKTKIELYKGFIYNAIIMSLINITGYSMNMADNELYENKEWNYGGIHNIMGNGMEFCMIFNKKSIDQIYADCPLIPDPRSKEFEYVSVGLLYVEADVNVDAYREYIMDIMDLDEFHKLFRKYLNQYVIDDQQLFIINENGNGYLSDNVMNKIQIIGISVIVICFVLCMIMIGYFSTKWYQIKDSNIDINREISEDRMCAIDRYENKENGNRNYERVSMVNSIENYGENSVPKESEGNNILKIYRKITISRRTTSTDDGQVMENGITYTHSHS